jgi:large subunit ribosomal protein L18
MEKAKALQARRKQRVRSHIRRRKNDRPRLSIFRSGKNIYAQVIDDRGGSTLAAASTLDKEIRSSGKSGSNKDAAAAVGKLVAERAVSKGLSEDVFDRGAYLFHGRIKALADAAREAGLKF